jgi:hypothetical protein
MLVVTVVLLTICAIVLRSAVALLAAMNATDLGARSDARDVGAWVDLVSLGER